MFSESVAIAISDNESLDASFSRPRNSDKVVIITHGLGSDKESEYASAFERKLTKSNISTLRYSNRGSGLSSGDFFDFTFSQAVQDLETVINYLKNKNYKNIGIVGNSINSAAALEVTSKQTDSTIKTLALISCISNYPKVLKDHPNLLAKWKEEGSLTLPAFGDKKLSYEFVTDLKNHTFPVPKRSLNAKFAICHASEDPLVSYKSQAEPLLPDSTSFNVFYSDHHSMAPYCDQVVKLSSTYIESTL